MLKQLRSKRVMKRIMKVTLVLVIPSFVFLYGWSTFQSNRGGQADGRWIARLKSDGLWDRWRTIGLGPLVIEAENSLRRRAFQATYGRYNLQQANREVDRMIREFSQSLPRRAVEAANLLILDQAARKEQVAVPREEMFDALRQQIERQRQLNPQELGGMSDRQIADRYFPDFGPREHALLRREHVRETRRLEGLISLHDAWYNYEVRMENVEAEWVKFSVYERMMDVKPTTEALRQHFDEHAEDYAFPDRRKYEYVVARRSALADDVEITTGQIRKYYDEHQDQFLEPRAVKPRIIRVSRPEDATTTEALKEYVDRLTAVSRAVSQPEADFAALANEYSDDPANIDPEVKVRKLGGLLPEPIAPGRPSDYGPEVDMATLALEEGATTGPIQTAEATFFIKAEEVMPARPSDFEDVRADIEEILKQQAIDERFEELRKTMREERLRQTTMAGLARALDLHVMGPVIVDKDSVDIPTVGRLTGEEETIEELNKTRPRTPVIERRNFLIVLQLLEEIPARPATYEEVEAQVKQDLRAIMAARKAREAAEALAAKARESDKSFAELAQAANAKVTTGSFQRSDPPFGPVMNFESATQDLTTGTLRVDKQLSQFATDPESEGAAQAYVVWRVTGLDSPSREEFLEERARLFLALNSQSVGDILVREWLADERRRHDFEVSELVR